MKKFLISSIFVAVFMQYFTVVSHAQSADFIIKDNNARYSPPACSGCGVPGTYVDVAVDLWFYADPSLSLVDWTHLWEYSLTSTSISPCPDISGSHFTGTLSNVMIGRIPVDCVYNLSMTHTICSVVDPNNCFSSTSDYLVYKTGKNSDVSTAIGVHQSKVEYKNDLPTNATVMLTDINGRIIAKKEVNRFETETFDTANLSSGIYLLSAYQDGKMNTKKISIVN